MAPSAWERAASSTRESATLKASNAIAAPTAKTSQAGDIHFENFDFAFNKVLLPRGLRGGCVNSVGESGPQGSCAY